MLKMLGSRSKWLLITTLGKAPINSDFISSHLSLLPHLCCLPDSQEWAGVRAGQITVLSQPATTGCVPSLCYKTVAPTLITKEKS